MRSARLHKLSKLEIDKTPFKESDYTINDGGNLYVNIRRYQAKEWLFRYVSPVTGKRRNTSLGRYPDISCAEARRIAAEKRALLDQNLDPIMEEEKKVKTELALHKEQQAIERNTVEAIFYEWKKVELKNRKDHGTEIERAFTKDVFPLIGKKLISQVERQDIWSIFDKILKRGSKRMANRMLSDFRQFIGYAIDEEYLDKDITARITKKRVGGTEEKRKRFLSEEERTILAKILPESDLQEKYQNAIWIILSTGCRIQELSKATWNNIDFRQRTFTIPETDAKNKKMHTIHLSDFALKHFEELYTNRVSETWVFPSRDSDSYTNRRTISKQITDRQEPEQPITGRCKDNSSLILPGGRWTVHDLRRTAATAMQELGIFPHIIKKCLNQTIDDPIIQTYQVSNLEDMQISAFNQLGNYWQEMHSHLKLQSNCRY